MLLVSRHENYVFALALICSAANADPADILRVSTTQSADGWRFDVTLSHPDTGWDHYADGWRVETEDGQVLATRVLAHPHVHEQPFTRSLSRIWIPPEITRVFVRSKCSVDGWSEDTTKVDLKQ
ncbi:hypothetical protein [Shimia marina]|uniref:Secreted protein n=1 Tax=Shimia marina TaxID=321267 RepID=A0A0P1FC59_9RHOB|nr:hypothetical protein [Shimia marina]CUH51025.1 hypothetical protein SHM7688_00458 [Shimia marina]